MFQKWLENREGGGEKVLVIMRGVSGSGKSTKSRQIAGPKGVVLSTDDFWGDNYDFDASKIGEAHAWNQDRAKKAMQQGLSPIVIDNTNLSAWEPKPYVIAAKEYGYRIEFGEPDTKIWEKTKEANKLLRELSQTLSKLNTHGVPAEIIMKMITQYVPDLTPEKILQSKSPWE